MMNHHCIENFAGNKNKSKKICVAQLLLHHTQSPEFSNDSLVDLFALFCLPLATFCPDLVETYSVRCSRLFQV